VSWYVCTIGRQSPGNWDLCKQVGLYGIPSGRARPPRVEVGDRLLVWQGGRGYIAEAMITGPMRVPISRAEAPWPGGTYRFGYVVPIQVTFETRSPLKLPFNGDKQSVTGFSKNLFRRSFSLVPDQAATHVSSKLREEQA
jgi:hypothetical protein